MQNDVELASGVESCEAFNNPRNLFVRHDTCWPLEMGPGLCSKVDQSARGRCILRCSPCLKVVAMHLFSAPSQPGVRTTSVEPKQLRTNKMLCLKSWEESYKIQFILPLGDSSDTSLNLKPFHPSMLGGSFHLVTSPLNNPD